MTRNKHHNKDSARKPWHSCFLLQVSVFGAVKKRGNGDQHNARSARLARTGKSPCHWRSKVHGQLSHLHPYLDSKMLARKNEYICYGKYWCEMRVVVGHAVSNIHLHGKPSSTQCWQVLCWHPSWYLHLPDVFPCTDSYARRYYLYGVILWRLMSAPYVPCASNAKKANRQKSNGLVLIFTRRSDFTQGTKWCIQIHSYDCIQIVSLQVSWYGPCKEWIYKVTTHHESQCHQRWQARKLN